MKTDKDRPGTWIKFRPELCQKCISTCCTMPVEVKAHDLVRLNLCSQDEVDDNPKKVAQRLIKEGILSSFREKTGLFTFTQKSNSDCYFLDQNRRCTVYENRPDVCRKFPLEMSRRMGYCPYIKRES